MQIFRQFPISLQQYYQLGKLNIFPELYGCPHPGCLYRGRLRQHGFYSRTAIMLTEVLMVWIRRYYCPACKCTTSVLPSFLLPRRQYAAAAIQWILRGLYQLNQSMAELVRNWKVESVPFTRQYIQHIRRCFERRHKTYRMFLKTDVESTEPVGAVIMSCLGTYGGKLENLAHDFNMSWKPAFLLNLRPKPLQPKKPA